MPPVALAAGATALGGLGSTLLQSRATGKATKAQQNANTEAMAYAREQEAKREAASAARLAQARKSMDAWYQRYGDEGLKRFGIPSWWSPGGGDAAAAPAGAAPMAPTMKVLPTTGPRGQNLAAITGVTGGPAGKPVAFDETAPLAPSMAPQGLTPEVPPQPLIPDEVALKRRPRTLAALSGLSSYSR